MLTGNRDVHEVHSLQESLEVRLDEPSTDFAITVDTCSAAAFTGSAARWAYRAVVATWVCPSSLPIIGRPWPAATAAEAKRVAQVVDAGVLEPGAGAEPLPERLQIDEPAAGLDAVDHPRIAGQAREPAQVSIAGLPR